MRSKIKPILAAVCASVGVLYPLVVYIGVETFSLRSMSLVLGLSFIGAFLFQAKHSRPFSLATPLMLAIGFCILSALSPYDSLVRYVPVVFSISLAVSFGYTLVFPPSMIEVFARMILPDRSPEEIAYCRRVTIMWVVFFLANGTLALYTACCTSLAVWSVYNGLISYCLIGLFFAIELVCRYRRFRRYAGLRTDVIFKRLFPPKE